MASETRACVSSETRWENKCPVYRWRIKELCVERLPQSIATAVPVVKLAQWSDQPFLPAASYIHRLTAAAAAACSDSIAQRLLVPSTYAAILRTESTARSNEIAALQ